MSLNVNAVLKTYFAESRIVLWHDPNREFEADLASLVPAHVNLVRVDNESALALKSRIEVSAATDSFLLYSNKPEPAPENDWLLDVRLYSRLFRADAVSIQMDELGLFNRSMTEHLKRRAKFLRAKDRLEKLKRWVAPADDEAALDRKMIAVIARSDQADEFSILQKLYSELCPSDPSMDSQMQWDSKALAELENYELTASFWWLMREQFGYSSDAPTLRDLLLRLLTTDLLLCRNGTHFPDAIRHFVLPESRCYHQVRIFCDRWRRDMQFSASYDALSEEVAAQLRLDSELQGFDVHELRDVHTFSIVEKRILSSLRDLLLKGDEVVVADVHGLISARREGHWANELCLRRNNSVGSFIAAYDAVAAAANYLSLHARNKRGLSFATAEEAYRAYESELYQFDQCYRQFMHASDLVEMYGWQLLLPLKAFMEERYAWFTAQLAVCWGGFVEQRLSGHWQLDGVARQTEFYARHVDAPLKNGRCSRVFVIISDALRYEVAQELAARLHSKNRLKADLESQLGVLPSYTTLGMAALLPHRRLDYKASVNVDVLADGKPTASTEQRSAILAAHKGVALKVDDLIAMGKDAGRAFVRDHAVVYLYHNEIDATGDQQIKEGNTFDACNRTLDQIERYVQFIINALNGSTVVITADHGFLYQETALDESDKSALTEKPAGALKAKKRYLLGTHLGTSEKAWSGSTATTAGTTDSLEFWIPKGNNRFHFSGGARFVHGGAMLQEIVVPVLTVREGEGANARTRKVDIALLGSLRKVVTNRQKFEFIQTEATTDKLLPRSVRMSLGDGDRLVSDQITLTFDSSSPNLDERRKTVFLTVMSGIYDKQKEYHLIVRDADDDTEVLRMPYRIDLAFTNDF